MADVVHDQVRVRVERRLEGEQGEQAVRGRGDGARPPPAPCVHGRADVVRHGNPRLLQSPLQQQVEHVEVDADEGIEAGFAEGSTQPSQQQEKLGQAQERIDEAVHGERLRPVQRLQARLAHRRAADAHEGRVRCAPPQRAHERRPQTVPRGLPGDETDPRRVSHPRPDRPAPPSAGARCPGGLRAARRPGPRRVPADRRGPRGVRWPPPGADPSGRRCARPRGAA